MSSQLPGKLYGENMYITLFSVRLEGKLANIPIGIPPLGKFNVYFAVKRRVLLIPGEKAENSLGIQQINTALQLYGVYTVTHLFPAGSFTAEPAALIVLNRKVQVSGVINPDRVIGI